LRETRKKLGLDIDEVARQLRMSARQILALEEENFAALSTPPFVRGFIRNYAKLLKLDAEPLLEAYREAVQGQPDKAAITLQSERIAIVSGARRTWVLYLAASVLVLFAGSAWWVYMEQGKQKPAAPVAAKTAPEVNTRQAVAPAPPIAVALPEPYAPAVAQPAPVTPQPAPVVTTPEPIPASAASGTAQGDIRFVIAEPTWISVTDGTGKEVFNKNKASGTEDFAGGKPPFRVVVGNVNGAQVSYKGKPFDMVPYTRANVARFTLE
jgi:cytoskeleton protein RodZ